uniref:Uncharacterized protein n=1 Tax=Neisseria meningitidis alpha275 TaxID=295996 RepID=C6SJ69_NEIME|nr:hypothetical protein predicted by Glimmer/Critica [Neisseria meningitidis alpha275]
MFLIDYATKNSKPRQSKCRLKRYTAFRRHFCI